MENWDNQNLPENHKLFEKVTFVAVTEGTWNRKKNDGTNEVAKKWGFITQETEDGPSMEIAVYSATDREEIKLNTSYDVIVKQAIGKDGTFYGYSLKGFGPAGQPIPKKEPSSRWQKGQKLNAKAEALKATATIFSGKSDVLPDDVISYAEVLEAWLNGEYTPTESTTEKSSTKKK